MTLEHTTLFTNGIILQTISLTGLFSSVFCMIVTLWILKLNKFIKSIIVIINMAAIVNISLSLWAVYFLNKKYRCLVTSYTMLALLGTTSMPAMISILRIRMAKLASKAKLIKPLEGILVIFSLSVLSMLSFPLSTLLQEQFEYQNLIARRCLDGKDRPKNVIFPAITILTHFSLICIGLFCDISLYFFVKHQSWAQQNGTSLVPWKSTEDKKLGQEDTQVPIRATIVATCLIFIMLGVSISGTISIYEAEYVNTMYFAVCSIVFTSVSLPIVLVTITVKHQNKINVSQPPRKLQFHEEDIELDPNRIELHI